MSEVKKNLCRIMLLAFLLVTLIEACAYAADSPTVVVSGPTTRLVTDPNPSVIIEGFVTNTSILKISLNGYQLNVPFSSNGFFSYAAGDLRQGNNYVKVIAVASSGTGTVTKEITVIYNPGALTPQITVLGVDENVEVTDNPFTFNVSLQNTNSLIVIVNGQVTDMQSYPGDFTSTTVPLTEGTNTVELIADSGTAQTTKVLHLKYTWSALINDLQIDGYSVTDYYETPNGSAMLTGSNSKGSSITVILNGLEVPCDQADPFSAVLENLKSGYNIVDVKAQNSVRSETRQIKIYCGLTGSQVFDVTPEGTVYSKNVTITGKVSYADSVSMTLNGGTPVTRTTKTSYTSPVAFSFSLTLLPGENSVVISTTDNTGVPNDFTYILTYETNPVITVDALPYQVYTKSITITGKALNVAAGGLKINGETTTFNSSTRVFSKVINLKSGVNVITVTGLSPSGVSISFEPIIVDYRGGPLIFNLLPNEGSIVSSESVSVSGTVSNVIANSLKIFVNGDTTGLTTGFDSNGYFNRTVKLTPGDNKILVTASDGYTVVTNTINITYSTTPVIVVKSPVVKPPLDKAKVLTDKVIITGNVFNTQINGLIIDGETVPFNSSTGSFSKTVNLKGISNLIEIRALNGKMTTIKQLGLEYCGVLTINVASPASGDIDRETVIFEGSVFPFNLSEVSSFTIAGSECLPAINSDGTFRTDPITLPLDEKGKTEIDLVLQTIYDQSISRKMAFTYKQGPVITVSAPLDGSTFYTNTVSIQGKLTKADFNTLKIGDKLVTPDATGSFQYTYSLKEGKNEISLSASYGKDTTKKTVTVYYSQIAKEGAEVRIKVDDGVEIKAFDDLVKIKTVKGSVGLGTEALLSVEKPIVIDDPPSQSVFIGPLIKLAWEGSKPVKPYKLTLKYDAVVAENQAHKVSIFFYDEEEDEWQILGGVVDAKTRTVSIETDQTGYFAAMIYFRIFDDVRNHWALRDIEFLTARGAVTGSSGYFKPDANITRAEFVTFFVKALGLTVYEQDRPSYHDVGKGNWAYEYIETALRAGIVTGVSHDSFAPERTISREEAGILLALAANLKPLKDQEIPKIYGSFSDAGKVGVWARNQLAAAVKAKIINGSADGKLLPAGRTTRAQAAAMIARLAEIVNKTKK